MTAQQVKELLRLEPHPREGGWFVQTYAAEELLPAPSFTDGRYSTSRRTSTAIYYLLEPDTFSEMHMLQSDEVFHFYAGDPVEMLQLRADGQGSVITLGSDLMAGQRPQVLAERGVWQGSRLLAGGSWALLGCTVSPGFEYEDYTAAGRAELSAKWPSFTAQIGALTRF